ILVILIVLKVVLNILLFKQFKILALSLYHGIFYITDLMLYSAQLHPVFILFCTADLFVVVLQLTRLITVMVLALLNLPSVTLTKYSTLKLIPVTLAVLRLMFGIQSLANVLHPKTVVTFSVNVNPLLS
ncbi:hypothetical protein EFU47_17745, partial [Vibrio cholerae]|nr:hypothetical protein [Vibrio cholerae]